MNSDDFAHNLDTPVVHMDCGENVYCDICNKDWTNSNKPGGIYLFSRVYCPDCEESGLDSLQHIKEQIVVKVCPINMSFADWVRDIVRKGQI